MLRSSALTLACLLLAGCVTRGIKIAPGHPGASAKSGHLNEFEPSPSLILGRIIAFDAQRRSVFIEIGPYNELPADFATRLLISRNEALAPTATLQSSVYLRGRILGTRLLSGNPDVGDEVVWAPAVP